MKIQHVVPVLLLGVFTLGTFLRAADETVVAPETKEQRDARMAWWREAKFGMFIHWGVYAVPAGEWPGKATMTSDKHIRAIPIGRKRPQFVEPRMKKHRPETTVRGG